MIFLIKIFQFFTNLNFFFSFSFPQTDKLIYTLQLQAFTIVPLFLAFNNVIVHRIMYGIANPLSGSEALIEKPVRILTNTVEQTILTVISQLVLSTYIRTEYMYWMPFLVFLFVLGRILFMVGYMIHPKFRGVGFVIATFASSSTLLFNLVCALGFVRLVPSFGTGSHKEF